MRLLAFAVLLLLTACPPPAPTSGCSPSSCEGCCDKDGVCQLGSANTACGTLGDLCTPCGTGLGCSQGACRPGNGGTGGGSSGTGGGSNGTGGGSSGTGGGSSGTGGYTGQVDQELLSGSRLRGMFFVGNDGSKVGFSTMFWDNQLNAYCSPSFYAPVCFPARLAYNFYGTYYRDTACSQSDVAPMLVDYGAYFADAGQPAGSAYFLDIPDGGIAIPGFSFGNLYTANPVSNVYTKNYYDGGCERATNIGYSFWTRGTQVPTSALAPMALVRE